MVVDFGNYHEMEYDEETGVVRVSSSTTSADLTAFLHPKGRMFAGGHCGDVGLGGFLLQGGMGWNSRVLHSGPRSRILLTSAVLGSHMRENCSH